MTKHHFWRQAMAACALLTFTLAAIGADAPAPDRKEADQLLQLALRDVINRGRDHYNNGNPSACYFMWQGALQIAALQLDGRPELQKAVKNGLVEAEANPDMRQRAWLLRNVLDKVRTELKSDGAPPVAGEKIAPPMPAVPGKPAPEPLDKKPAPAPAEATLWMKLGGQEAVEKVVDDFVAIAAANPKVNFDRDGKLKFTEEQIAMLKKQLVAFVSAASGGPIKYTGKSMKEAHKGMEITDAEFDASVDDLVKAMEKNGVKDEEIKAVRTAVEGTRKDIVTKKE